MIEKYYVIILIGCFFCAMLAAIASLWLPLKAKMENTAFVTSINMKVESLLADISAVKTDLSRLNFENYEQLATKFKRLEMDVSSLNNKVETVDSSLKNHFSKWAKKLGQMDKINSVTVPEDVTQAELPQLPPGFQTVPNEQQIAEVPINKFQAFRASRQG